MAAADYVEAVRLRIGIAGPMLSTPCKICGQASDLTGAAHALCCAQAESTRGHTAVTHTLADEIGAIDNTMEVEPMGLIPRTSYRPADVLTGILAGNMTALDICIASPDAQGATEDYLNQAVGRKRRKYGEHLRKLE